MICQWRCRDTKWTAVVIFNSAGLELHIDIFQVVSNLMGETGMFEDAESCSNTLHSVKIIFLIYANFGISVKACKGKVIPLKDRFGPEFG